MTPLDRMLALVGRMDIAYLLGGTSETEMDCFQAAVCYAHGLKHGGRQKP